MTDPADRTQTPDEAHPVLELTYEVKSTHRLRLDPARWADDFADWFEKYNDDETPLSPAQINELLMNARHLPEMFRDHLIQESAGDHNCLGAEMDDYDLDVAWVAACRSSTSGGESR